MAGFNTENGPLQLLQCLRYCSRRAAASAEVDFDIAIEPCAAAIRHPWGKQSAEYQWIAWLSRMAAGAVPGLVWPESTPQNRYAIQAMRDTLLIEYPDLFSERLRAFCENNLGMTGIYLSNDHSETWHSY
jgi:hypothetical protein